MAGLGLPVELLRVLERAADERGLAPEAVLAELLLRIAEPGERPRVLLGAARSLLGHAVSAAERGEMGLAFRRLWSAVVLSLEAVLGEEAPGGLEAFWDASERLGPEAMRGFYAGLAAYLAARENLGSRRHFEEIRALVEGLLGAVEESLAGAAASPGS